MGVRVRERRGEGRVDKVPSCEMLNDAHPYQTA